MTGILRPCQHPIPLMFVTAKSQNPDAKYAKRKSGYVQQKKLVADLMPKGEKCVESECVNVVHDSTCVVVSDA